MAKDEVVKLLREKHEFRNDELAEIILLIQKQAKLLEDADKALEKLLAGFSEVREDDGVCCDSDMLAVDPWSITTVDIWDGRKALANIRSLKGK